jgi:hypothetical protein
MPEPLRALPTDLEKLALAWDSRDDEIADFLDLETGAVVTTMTETLQDMEWLRAENDDVSFDALQATIDHSDLEDWERDALREALSVEAARGTRWIRVPHEESRDAYRDMEEFVESVRDQRLQERLGDAIHGRGAFPRFKDVLTEHPTERVRWFAFQSERVRERILAWLAEEGIVPSAASGAGTS